MSLPTISVTVPTSAATSLILNPYGLEADIDGAAGSETTTSKVYSPVLEITSNSNVPLSVNVVDAVVTKGTNSNATIATAALKGTETSKNAFLYMAFGKKSGSTYGFATETTGKGTGQLILGTSKKTTTGIITMEAKSSSGDAVVYGYKIAGDLSVPANSPWVSGDALSVAYKFVFVPQLIET